MEKSSHYEITAQYEEGNSNEIDENVRNLIVGSFMPWKQEIKKFSHISCLIRLRLAPKITCKRRGCVYVLLPQRHLVIHVPKRQKVCRCFLNPLTSRYVKVYHIFIFLSNFAKRRLKSRATPPEPQPLASTYSSPVRQLTSLPIASLIPHHQHRRRRRGCHGSL